MRVLYDYQGFTRRYGGVSRYFVELIAAMGRVGGYEAIIPDFFSDNVYLERKQVFLTRSHFKGKGRIMTALNRRISLRAFSRDYDLFHPTYFNPYFLGRNSKPFVVTVHDMIHELYDGTYVRDDGTKNNTRILCERAAKIIAVSENTKNDITRLLGISEKKVTVVHHATTLHYNNSPRLHGRPYLLYVGAREGYKNFARFMVAVAPILLRLDIDLVCAGGGPFSSDEHSALRTYGLMDRVVQLPFFTQDELASLYHFAEVFCYPSLYEGFGIPILEAFSCGCPVAASSTSCFPEIAGPAAEYFDPTKAESIVQAVETVIENRKQELVRLGSEQLSRYSWERSAFATLDVYRFALEG